jgi:hypothetical protein
VYRQAGHLLHIDNPQEFAMTVIQAHFTPLYKGKPSGGRRLGGAAGANTITAITTTRQQQEEV